MTARRKTALVTGAGKRVGRAIALGLAGDGFDIIAHYNSSASEAEEVVREIAHLGCNAWPIQADLSDPQNAAGLVNDAVAKAGALYLLVNVASLFEDDSLATMTHGSWDRLLDVNVASPVFLMKAFAQQPHLPEGASIVNFLDQQMLTPNPQFFSYFVAKIGLEGATRLAAFELAPKIRVNGIAPGLTLPSFGQDEERFLAQQNRTPMRSGLRPEHLMDALRYLANAERVTGQTIYVDSGQHLMGLGNSTFVAKQLSK